MSTQVDPTDRFADRFDVVIIGGGASGTSAALQLGRIGLSVAIVDDGQPRNAPARHMHGFAGFDGTPPADFLNRARQDLKPYDVTVITDRVATVDRNGPTSFVATTDSRRRVTGRRVLLTTGLTDELPDIPGLRDRWGSRAIHCPWCHGWEHRGGRVAILDGGAGHHQALLMARLSNHVTLFEQNGQEPPEEARAQLRLAGVTVDHRSVVALEGEDQVALTLDDGQTVEVDVVFVGPRFGPNMAMVGELGPTVTSHPMGLGEAVTVSDTGETSVSGLYAAGNVADPMQQVLHAAADGSRTAMAMTADIMAEDHQLARRSETDGKTWDERYGDHDNRMWRSTPNGSLVVEVDGMEPARVLDVGCGEGADAIWLAEQGWKATGIDISSIAVDRARAAAEQRGSDVDFQVRDVITDPFPTAGFELVTISYPALRQPDGSAAILALVEAIAPDGEVLVIGHDVNPDATHGFDPSDYVSIDQIIELLGSEFQVVVDEVRDRPNPPEGAHHTADRILRARRLT